MTEGIQPKPSGCGPIYEFTTNPIEGRPNEDFCIADMRELAFADPHYHPDEVSEIYFVLRGIGKVVVGTDEPRDVSQGDIIVIPPMTAHYTIPMGDLVLAVVNTPPFKPEDYIQLDVISPQVAFDMEQFRQLARS